MNEPEYLAKYRDIVFKSLPSKKSEHICMDCLQLESHCECKGITSTPVKDIELSEHITQVDAERILLEFQRQPDWTENTIPRLIAFSVEYGIENERSK